MDDATLAAVDRTVEDKAAGGDNNRVEVGTDPDYPVAVHQDILVDVKDMVVAVAEAEVGNLDKDYVEVWAKPELDSNLEI